MNEACRWCVEDTGVKLEGQAFAAEGFEPLVSAEETHFWFRARNRLIIWALQRYFPHVTSFLEMGCGAGNVLRAIKRARPGLSVFGGEMYRPGLALARRRMPDVSFVCLNAKAPPFAGGVEAVGIFDVLEHIEDDEAVLRRLSDMLVPGGGLLITVPQHQWLWGGFDDFSGHQRRYSRDELIAKVERAGFSVLRSTSFVSFILPCLAWRRIRSRDPADFDPEAEMRISRLANFVGAGVMSVERFLVKLGLSLPWGASLLLVARRNDAAPGVRGTSRQTPS